MNITRKSKMQLIALAIAIALTAPALIKVVNEIIIPTIYPPPPRRLPPPILTEVPQDPLSSGVNALYNISPYIAPVAWIAFLLTLYWKGKTRMLWHRRGYDYDTFRLLSKMRGSDARLKILRNLFEPKNRLQLANELGMDWKSIDGHVDLLMKYSLIKEMNIVGTTKYLAITEKGREALDLLENGNMDSRQK